MPQKITSAEPSVAVETRTGGLVLLPPVSMDDLLRDIEPDPDGVEEFVALMRTLRHMDSRPDAL